MWLSCLACARVLHSIVRTGKTVLEFLPSLDEWTRFRIFLTIIFLFSNEKALKVKKERLNNDNGNIFKPKMMAKDINVRIYYYICVGTL